MSKGGTVHDQRSRTAQLPPEDVRSEPNVVEDQHKWTVFNSQVWVANKERTKYCVTTRETGTQFYMEKEKTLEKYF